MNWKKLFLEWQPGGMRVDRSLKGVAAVAHQLRSIPSSRMLWQLRWDPVCTSTENILSKWIEEKPLIDRFPRAVLSARQTEAFGQRGKNWYSPKGGVWISAVIPFLGRRESSGLFGLAVAVAISERLETKKVPVQIKWPNDLIVRERKLAGLLPRLVHRGSIVKYSRIGLGLNVFNKVPKGAISLHEVLQSQACNPNFWAAQVLVALERSMDFSLKEDWLCNQVEQRLWAKEIREPVSGDLWQIKGIDPSGGLKIQRGLLKKTLTRRYEY